MKRIILVGGGPHAEVVADIVEQQGLYQVAGITDTRRSVGDRFLGYTVIGEQEALQGLMDEHGVVGGIVCVGDNYLREKVALELRAQVPEFEFATAIHPSAAVSPRAEVGEGSVIMPGCVVNTSARVGRHCIINTLSSLEHRSTMGDYSSLSAGVITGGFVTLGEYSALALGVTVLDRVRIGRNVVVGSGSLVMKDTEDDVLMYGSPACVIRHREPGERWLKEG
jgi:sugar O-acyltransferase (sialic acid O-acetyltransferase NeuD family)